MTCWGCRSIGWIWTHSGDTTRNTWEELPYVQQSFSPCCGGTLELICCSRNEPSTWENIPDR